MKKIASIFILLLFSLSAFAQTAGLLPNAVQQYFDNNGNPLSGGTVTTYATGTSTLKTTWRDAGETIPNTNPIVLDTGGKAIIYGDGFYRQVLRDRNGNLIWDAPTSAFGNGGAALIGDGTAVGTVLPWSGLTAPVRYVFAYGQELSRVTYSQLFTAVTLSNNNIGCISGNPILSGFSDTQQIPVGAAVEASCVPSSTVVSKTPSTITLNNNATITGGATVRVFPFGNGNGTSTFNVPDFRGRAVAGRDNMGGTAATRLTATYFATPGLGANGGNQSYTIVGNNLPAYTPSGTIVSTVTDTHKHEMFANNNPSSNPPVSPTNAQQVSVANTASTAFSYGMQGTGTAATLGLTGGSTTPITVVSDFTGSAQGGSSTPFGIIQPTIELNYIIKILPDINISTLNVVTSLGGMTGDITCGANLICSGNDISVVPSFGTGDVTGPASSQSNNITVFLGSTGKIIADSGVNVAGNAIGLATINSDNQSNYFTPPYDAKAVMGLRYSNSEDVSSFTSGSFRDAFYISQTVNNSTNYGSVQHVNYGLRSIVNSFWNSGTGLYSDVYQDLIGLDGTAVGSVQNANRGVSGITTAAIQLGIGIASNEFSVQNPLQMGCVTVCQSLSMAAVQGILSPKMGAAVPGVHNYVGLSIVNNGKSATAAFQASSDGSGGDNGQFQYLIDGRGATINAAGIRMPASASGTIGTIIDYSGSSGGSWTDFNVSTGTYRWIWDGNVLGTLSPEGFSGKSIDVFAIGGQSNSQGQSGDPTLSPQVPEGFVYQWNGAFVTGNDPVGNASPSSAWPAFGVQYVAATGRRVLLVPSAVGGTDQCSTTGVSALNWDLTGTLAPALVSNVNAAMTAARAAGFTPIYRGVLWSQGENDAGAIGNNTNAYPSGSTSITGTPYPAGTTTITVSSGAEVINGQYALILLDNGTTYTSQFNVSGTTITLITPVPVGRTIPNGAFFEPYSKALYEACLRNMLNYFRTTTTDGTTFPELGFYISQTGNPSTTNQLGYQKVRDAQNEVAQGDEYTKIVFRGAVDFPARGMEQDYTASFTASISTNVMTVTAISSGVIQRDGTITGAGVSANTLVNAYGSGGTTGVGGIGTYQLNTSSTVGSSTLTQSGSPLHYKQEGYNEMGREMAKGVVSAQQTEGWLHQNYIVTRINLGGALRVSDELDIVLTSTAITGSPRTLPGVVATNTSFCPIAITMVDLVNTFSPVLQALGITATQTCSTTGAVISIYQPVTLFPQAVITASWVTGGATETIGLLTGASAYGWSPNMYFNKGNVTIGGSGNPGQVTGTGNLMVGPDILNIFGPTSGSVIVNATNTFPVGIFNSAAASTDNNVIRIANNASSDAVDRRIGILFQPNYNLFVEFGNLYGGAIISTSDGISGRTNIKIGGYEGSNTFVSTAGFAYNGGEWIGSACALTSAGAAYGQGSISLCRNASSGTDNNILALVNNAGNTNDQRVGILFQPGNPGGNNPNAGLTNATLYGRTIMALSENIVGTEILTFGGYRGPSPGTAPNYIEHARISAAGGFSVGTTTDAGSGNILTSGVIRANTGFSANGTLGINTAFVVPSCGTLTFLQGLLTDSGACGTTLTKTGDYTILSSDNGTTIALGGNVQFTVTLPAAGSTGFPVNYCVKIVNIDVYTGASSGRAKAMNITGTTLQTKWLYPQQSKTICNYGGVWVVTPAFERWRINQTVQFYANDSTGSDTLNDGLNASSPYKKVSTELANVVFASMDMPFLPGIKATINIAGNMSDCIHISGQPPGSEGRAAIIISGAGSGSTTFDCSTGDTFFFFGGATSVEFTAMKITGAGSCVGGYDGAKITVLTDIIYGNCTGAHVVAGSGAHIILNNDYTISGNASYHTESIGGGIINVAANTITCTGSPVFSIFAYSGQIAATAYAGAVGTGATPFTGCGGATGARFSVNLNAVLNTGDGSADANYFPGSSAGGTASGGQYQ